jgi:predicted DNA-binding transcriptional regulator AlpA
MDNYVEQRWLSRRQLADRLGLPIKTLAQWASKGTGPPYARMGRHVRYRLSDIVEWETERIDCLRDTAKPAGPTDRATDQVAPADFEGANADNVWACDDPHHL